MPGPELTFHGGTVRLVGVPSGAPDANAAFQQLMTWDARDHCYRAPAVAYAPVMRALAADGVEVSDLARGYQEIDAELRVHRSPFPYQKQALNAWVKKRCRGVVVLPTGAGKTQVAIMAIANRKRSALVVVPTLDLLNQWYDVLGAHFDGPIGLVGGGHYEIEPITVITYDSAHIHMERLGQKFGLIIFDECHHLPSESYALSARMCIAPFRLGLTATPERSDGLESEYDPLIGPVVYRLDITDLSGDYLAAYETVRIEVPLSEEERAQYDQARNQYLHFIRKNGIHMGAPDGWAQFLQRSSQSREGRDAFAAYRKQRSLALCAPNKLHRLEKLLRTHKDDRSLIFTEDNATVHEISKRLLIPAITHQTKVKERSHILGAFKEGTYHAIVTSKVLNEGVDVPVASVAIVLSGSGSVREHVQRLGRILRKREGKTATLYELVAAGTSEQNLSDRRRDHVAYR